MTIGNHVPAIRKWLSRMADEFQPVIVASNVAGITGGAIAAAGLITNRAFQGRPGGDT
ncbi:hypothetical protein WBP07_29140 [Novosphingobium sp. BL-8A]|uniref:hypothetical protein n=1 Tax=Novosphingobium sp. BL-8A TaxID=3127639 RepID=UPI003756728F